MTFERDFLDWMTRTVVIQPLASSSTDGYGARTFTSTSGLAATSCRIERRTTLVRLLDGREVTSSTVVICPPFAGGSSSSGGLIAPTVSSKITLPTGLLVSGSSQPPILAVEPHDDENGLHHWEIFL
jgi:hypothetical protein